MCSLWKFYHTVYNFEAHVSLDEDFIITYPCFCQALMFLIQVVNLVMLLRIFNKSYIVQKGICILLLAAVLSISSLLYFFFTIQYLSPSICLLLLTIFF